MNVDTLKDPSMSTDDQAGAGRISISAASALAGVSSHTLRKWESRHALVVPQRTDSGRRYYTDRQVSRLKLVKLLLENGHGLTHLASLSHDAFDQLGERYKPKANSPVLDALDLVGPNLCNRLTDWGTCDVRTHPQDGRQWLLEQANTSTPAGSRNALVIEVATLPPSLCEQLAKLRQTRFDHILIVARVASSRTRHHLRLQGLVVIDAVIPEPAMLALLEQTVPAVGATPVSDQRFSSAQLAAVAAMNPALECECPNHIAQLLIDLTAFEQYCGECKDTAPADAQLHAHLADITGQARQLLETALVAVAEADNLDLDRIGNSGNPAPQG